ncbi:protein mono-ADP-ribosyltransferase PARP14-like [Ptychodera flava]|uniref:protein mono-ADP-ribosyltransferase PARP14-like n=1 Tax=Ptychodera flava TaxID=63121 RepID=UPI003969D061
MVSNLAEETTEPLLSFYFESKGSGGGEVERVELNKENASALVYFKNFMDALNVLSKTHKLGDTMVHVESFYDFLGRGIPDSHTPDVEAETSTVIPLTPLQVRQLAILDFPSIAEKDYASAKIIIDHEIVRIDGDMENVDHIKTMAYKFLADVKVKLVPSSPFATFLSSEKARSQLTRVLKDSGVLAVYDSQGGDITISAVNQNDLHAAADVLYANVHQRVLNVPSESHSCLRGPGWQVFVNKAEEKFEVVVEYFTSQSDRVTITGFVDHVDGATADIQRYFDCNTTIDRFIDVAGGKVEFMFKHMKADLDKLTETGIVIKKKKDENPRATGVIIHGTKQNIDNGEKSIREYLDAICHDRRYMNEPGIARLFQQEGGQAHIRFVQEQNRCIIDVSICRDGRTGLTEEIEAPQRLHSSLTTVCHVHLYAGPRVLVMKGDITKMRVDAIVNPANNRLDHGGGVAKAIIDAGGKIIQEESNNIIENRGKLLDGEVVSTQPGRLHCKRLIHAVGPKWDDGIGKDSEKQRKEKKLLLADAVTQSLEEARKWSCKSVAIPAIGSGIFGFPVDVCTDVIVEAVETYIQESRLELIDVYLVDLEDEVCSKFKESLERYTRQSVEYAEGNQQSRIGFLNEGENDCSQLKCDKGSFDNEIATSEGKVIRLVKGNITEQVTDVIVSTTGKDMSLQNGGGVSQAVLRDGGAVIQKELDEVKRRRGNPDAGQVFVTKGGALKCKAMYHVFCGPWTTGGNGPGKVVSDIMRKRSMKPFMLFVVFKQKYFSSILPTGLNLFNPECGSDVSMTIGNVLVEIVEGDICEQSGDVIVNYTDTNLTCDRGVSKAIIEAAGPEVKSELRTIGMHVNFLIL